MFGSNMEPNYLYMPWHTKCHGRGTVWKCNDCQIDIYQDLKKKRRTYTSPNIDGEKNGKNNCARNPFRIRCSVGRCGDNILHGIENAYTTNEEVGTENWREQTLKLVVQASNGILEILPDRMFIVEGLLKSYSTSGLINLWSIGVR